MPRELSPEKRAQYEALLRTSEGKETVAKNLNRLIRRRAAESGTSTTAFVVDNVLPSVEGNRDATIFLLTVLADIAVENHVGRRFRLRRSTGVN